jgi:hypothetical protein
VADIESSSELFVSAASAWEMAIKYEKGRWPEVVGLLGTWDESLSDAGIKEVPITARHGLQPWTPPLFGTSLRLSALNLNDARNPQFSKRWVRGPRQTVRNDPSGTPAVELVGVVHVHALNALSR